MQPSCPRTSDEDTFFPHIVSVAQSKTAMATAVFNDVAAWILLTLAVALAGKANGSGSHKSPLVSMGVLLSGLAFVIFDDGYPTDDEAGGATVLAEAQYGGWSMLCLQLGAQQKHESLSIAVGCVPFREYGCFLY
ncbi:hypothetical protein S245_044740 [Arachis hypogaea]